MNLYLEGGGNEHDAEQMARARELFAKFIERAGIDRADSRLRIIPCGPRQSAHKSFRIQLELADPETQAVLLVDSEDPKAPGSSKWGHLEGMKSNDRLERPPTATEDDVFLMVRAMEAWLLADPAALTSYWPGAAVPSGVDANPESLTKRQHGEILEVVASSVNKRRRKWMTFEALALADPAKVAAACPHAAEFLGALRERCGP